MDDDTGDDGDSGDDGDDDGGDSCELGDDDNDDKSDPRCGQVLKVARYFARAAKVERRSARYWKLQFKHLAGRGAVAATSAPGGGEALVWDHGRSRENVGKTWKESRGECEREREEDRDRKKS